VVVDRLTKWAIFIPTTTKLDTTGLVKLIIDNVICHHGMPTLIISNQGSKFTSQIWAKTCRLLGTKVALSTAFHPQTDGQTERVNQVLEQYLRIFVSNRQDDWANILQLAAFSYNNSIHSAISMSPFYANYGYHPRWSGSISNSDSQLPSTVEKVIELHEVHDLCKSNIALANLEYAKYYNANRREGPDYKEGDQVLLLMRNITTSRPSKKLDIKYSGPFTIIKKISPGAFRLELPSTMKCHNVFNISSLLPFHPTVPGQSYSPPAPVEVDKAGEVWEVKRVVDSRILHQRLEYQVKWKGFEGTPEETTWEPAENVENSPDLIRQFHLSNPLKPSPSTSTSKSVKKKKTTSRC